MYFHSNYERVPPVLRTCCVCSVPLVQFQESVTIYWHKVSIFVGLCLPVLLCFEGNEKSKWLELDYTIVCTCQTVLSSPSLYTGTVLRSSTFLVHTTASSADCCKVSLYMCYNSMILTIIIIIFYACIASPSYYRRLIKNTLQYLSDSLVQSILVYRYSSEEQYTPCSHHILQCRLLQNIQ